MGPRTLSAITFICLSAAIVMAGLNRGKEVTFSRDVAPIFYQHCAGCHRPNDIAPFSLLTYKEARPWARSIKEKVITREMPPWHADPHYGEFNNASGLSHKEVAIVAAWVDQGAKEGDPGDLPPLPETIDGWKIGTPDQVLAMAEEHVIIRGAPDNYAYFVIPTSFKADQWIEAAEIRPGNPRVVHHAIAHVFTSAAIARSQSRSSEPPGDEATAPIFYKAGTLARVRTDAPVIDDGASAANGGAAFKRRASEEGSDLFSILLTSYAPGKGPDCYPPGYAKRVPAGSVIVLQVHYSSFRGALNRPETDRTRIGLRFAKTPAPKAVRTLTIQNHFFKIPPGAPNHEVTAAYTFDQDVELINYMPHMHLRGKDVKYQALYPDGRRETLLSVPRFNFNWQTLYVLKHPVMLPKGTRVIITAHFDNSAGNRYNPDPTRAVRWGDPTDDEMLVAWMDYVAASPHHAAPPRKSQ